MQPQQGVIKVMRYDENSSIWIWQKPKLAFNFEMILAPVRIFNGYSTGDNGGNPLSTHLFNWIKQTVSSLLRMKTTGEHHSVGLVTGTINFWAIILIFSLVFFSSRIGRIKWPNLI